MQYPHDRGSKAHGPCQNAAEARTRRAKTMRARVFGFLAQQYPSSFTADQIAAGLGASISMARPRLSELRRSELIEPTSERRKNKSGMMARCSRVVVSLGGAVRDALKERGRA